MIKCNAYATTSSGQRESLGYFMIDIRPLNTSQVIHSLKEKQRESPLNILLENSLASTITNEISKIET